MLHPGARALLDQTKAQLRALDEELARRCGSCELEEPTSEEVASLQALVRRAVDT